MDKKSVIIKSAREIAKKAKTWADFSKEKLLTNDTIYSTIG